MQQTVPINCHVCRKPAVLVMDVLVWCLVSQSSQRTRAFLGWVAKPQSTSSWMAKIQEKQ